MLRKRPRKAASPLSNKDYGKALRKLHVELVKLQLWVQHKGLKVAVLFESRDGAGKGGTIKATLCSPMPAVNTIACACASSRPRTPS